MKKMYTLDQSRKIYYTRGNSYNSFRFRCRYMINVDGRYQELFHTPHNFNVWLQQEKLTLPGNIFSNFRLI